MPAQEITEPVYGQIGWDFNTTVTNLTASGYKLTILRPGYNGAMICDIDGIGNAILFPNQHVLVIKWNHDEAVETLQKLFNSGCPAYYKRRFPNYVDMMVDGLIPDVSSETVALLQ